MFSGDALSSWLLLFVGSGAACALAAVYRLLWRHRYRPLDAIGRRTFRVVGRVVSLPEESRDGDDPASDGERCIEIEIGERRHLVMTAGALIDGMGMRGLRLGTAHVSEKHANFIQAGDGGRAADVRALMELVREKVAAETGYVMRSEVRLVGFDDVAEPAAGVTW